jgi:hypothetical protein
MSDIGSSTFRAVQEDFKRRQAEEARKRQAWSKGRPLYNSNAGGLGFPQYRLHPNMWRYDDTAAQSAINVRLGNRSHRACCARRPG